MKIDKAIDRLRELHGKLTGEGRLEKADSVRLGIEALKHVQKHRPECYGSYPPLLPGETPEEEVKN